MKFVDLSKYKPEDLLIARVAWTPDSKTVMFQALNREQTFLDLNVGDVSTARSTSVLTETTPAWVEVYDNPVFVNRRHRRVWQSARNGWQHLYLYDNNGKLHPPVDER